MRSQHVTYRGSVLGPKTWGKCEVLILSLLLASLSLHIHTDLLREPLDCVTMVCLLLAFCGPPLDTSAHFSCLCSVVLWIQAAKWSPLGLPG